MPLKVTDPIIGPSRGSAAEAKAYAKSHNAGRLDEVNEFIDVTYDLCAPDDMPDAAIVIVQSVHETTYKNRPWNSRWWNERLNSAGMGITGDEDENEASHYFASGAEAARAQVAHLLLYATGKIDRGGLTPDDDVRYRAYVKEYGNTAKATTINGLTGKWGMDSEYASKLVGRGPEVFPNLPDYTKPTIPGDSDVSTTVVYGRVPHPAVTIRDVPSSINSAWDDLGPRTIRAIALHRSLGTHLGNDQWFRGGGAASALTDYGVAVAPIDGASMAGVLYRWNDPRGRRSPWANGRVSSPYGDGLLFFERYGVNAVNRDCTSIEISGWEASGFDEKAFETVAQLIAYWADQYHVSYETFPLIPSEGNRSFVIWHREFTIGTGKLCPWDIIMNATNALIARAKEILKKYQVVKTTPTTPPPTKPTVTYVKPKPVMVNGKAWDGKKDVVVNGITFHGEIRKVHANTVGVTECYQYATRSSDQTREPVKPGGAFNVIGWVNGEDIIEKDDNGKVILREKRWWVTDAGTRIWVGDTIEKPKEIVTKPGTKPTEPGDNQFDEGPITNLRADGRPVRVKVTADSLEVHKYATSTSVRTRTNLTKGQSFSAVAVVKGESIDGNDLWLITPNDSRIHSAGTNIEIPAISK